MMYQLPYKLIQMSILSPNVPPSTCTGVCQYDWISTEFATHSSSSGCLYLLMQLHLYVLHFENKVPRKLNSSYMNVHVHLN